MPLTPRALAALALHLSLAGCAPRTRAPAPAPSSAAAPAPASSSIALTRSPRLRNTAPAAHTARRELGDLESPVAVRWVVTRPPHEERTLAGAPRTHVTLVAEIARRGALDLPLELTVRVPPGAALVRGTPQQTLPVSAPGTVTREEFELAYEPSGAPSEDALLVVDAQSASAGFHAEVPYRFGRAPAPVPRPPRGAPLVVNGVDWGAPIEITPAAP